MSGDGSGSRSEGCGNCGLRSERGTCMWFYVAPPVVKALIQATPKSFEHEPPVGNDDSCTQWSAFNDR
jgi:hypothetical protein